MTHDFSNAKPQMFDQRLCKQDKISLKELEIGIAKGGSILGTKLSPATRQEFSSRISMAKRQSLLPRNCRAHSQMGDTEEQLSLRNILLTS
jgi:hypothetical protein